MKRLVLAIALSVVAPGALVADPAHVEFVRVERTVKGWRMTVTVAHRDVDWTHYVDRFEVRDPEGNRLAVRQMTGPHAGQKKFTEVLTGLQVPQSARELVVMAHDRVNGFREGRTVTVDFARTEGPGFAVVKRPWNERYQYFLGEEKFFRSWRGKLLAPTLF
jgi:hypothetical protein